MTFFPRRGEGTFNATKPLSFCPILHEHTGEIRIHYGKSKCSHASPLKCGERTPRGTGYETKTYDAKRDGAKGANVIDAIENNRKILANKEKPKRERADALKFLVHFVGDVHQPLHACERDNDTGGGNGVNVQLPDGKKPIKLHAAWDTNIDAEDAGA